MSRNISKTLGRITAETGRGITRDPKTGSWAVRETSSERFLSPKRVTGLFKAIPREN